MSTQPWVRFFASDWLAGTRGMTAVETGVYITLIALMYERDGTVPNDPARLSRLCGASNSVFKRTLESLINEEKIIECENGNLTNNRVVEEQSYSQKRAQVARDNASQRWNKNSNENNGGDDAAAMPEQCNGNASKNAIQNQNQNQSQRSKNEPSKTVRDKSALDQIETALRSAGELENSTSPGLFNLSPILGLLDAGYSLDEDILPTIRAKKGSRVSSWAYFDQAIRQAREQRLNAGKQKAPADNSSTAITDEVRESGWRTAVRRWKENPSSWLIKAPPPGKPGCPVPEHILRDLGVQV